MKIFYSWQLDADRAINKDLVHGALEEAIRKLGETPDLDEAERNEPIELDHDTKGILGSPEIANTIFEKISRAQVFVADVSLVGKGRNDKLHINSNVAIELGYCLGKVGFESLLLVMNTYFGRPEQLPFDLQGRRFPVTYELAPDTDKMKREAAKKELADKLKPILRQYLEESRKASIAPHAEVPFVEQRGRWWQRDEVLSTSPSGKDIVCRENTLIYVRLIPERALPEIDIATALDLASRLEPLCVQDGFSHRRNRWGAMACDSVYADRRYELIGCTQVFRNREIWGVDCIHARRGEDDDGNAVAVIVTGAIHQRCPRPIDKMRKLAQELGYGASYWIEIGFSGAEGFRPAVASSYFNFDRPGPFHIAEVFSRQTVAADTPTGAILEEFWKHVFREVGWQEMPPELRYNPSPGD